jgi:hypothetical protein
MFVIFILWMKGSVSFFTQFDIFPGKMSYVNHRGPYVAPLGYIE